MNYYHHYQYEQVTCKDEMEEKSDRCDKGFNSCTKG